MRCCNRSGCGAIFVAAGLIILAIVLLPPSCVAFFAGVWLVLTGYRLCKR